MLFLTVVAANSIREVSSLPTAVSFLYECGKSPNRGKIDIDVIFVFDTFYSCYTRVGKHKAERGSCERESEWEREREGESKRPKEKQITHLHTLPPSQMGGKTHPPILTRRANYIQRDTARCSGVILTPLAAAENYTLPSDSHTRRLTSGFWSEGRSVRGRGGWLWKKGVFFNILHDS